MFRKYRLAIEALEPRLVLNSMGLADPFETSSVPYIASTLGVAEVAGRDLFVDVLFQVPAGANGNEAALAALAAQGARPFQSADYSTTGLVWGEPTDSDPGNHSVTQNYNSTNDPTDGAALAALLSGHTTWNNVSTSDFVFDYGGPTTRWPSLVRESPGRQVLDGNNDVAWMKLRGGGVLGVTWYDVVADEADMALNTQFSWATDGVNDFDIQTVFLHENGHVIGLGHSSVQGSIMEAIYAGPRQILHDDDIAGISSLYPADTAPVPGITVSPTAGLETSESGAEATFTVVLDTQPTDDVTIGLSSSDTTEGTVDPPSLTFASTNWDVPQTVTVTGVDDILEDGDIGYIVVIAAAVSGDLDYSGLDPNDVSVTNTDNETPPSSDSDMYVWEMTWSETHRGRGGSMTDLFVTVDVNQDSDGDGAESGDGAAANATTTLRLTHSTNTLFGDGDDTSWIGTAATNELGQITFKLRLAPDGNYQAEVTVLTHATFVWNSDLDNDNPDEYFGVPNGPEPFSSASSTAVLTRQSESLDAMFEEIAWFYAIDRPGNDKNPAAEAVDYLLTYQP